MKEKEEQDESNQEPQHTIMNEILMEGLVVRSTDASLQSCSDILLKLLQNQSVLKYLQIHKVKREERNCSSYLE